GSAKLERPWPRLIGVAVRASIAAAIVAPLALADAACRRRPTIVVAVVFDGAWKPVGATLTGAEKSMVEQVALATLRGAYDGFDVRFEPVAAPAGRAARARRTVSIENTPYRSYLSMVPPSGVAGVTYRATTSSSVRPDVLINLELAAVHCHDIDHCVKSRAELLRGLGRGIGATAAHELGH